MTKQTDKVIPFVCPQCGHQILKLGTKPKSIADFDGSICANCGFTVTKDYILAETRKVALKMIRKIKR